MTYIRLVFGKYPFQTQHSSSNGSWRPTKAQNSIQKIDSYLMSTWRPTKAQNPVQKMDSYLMSAQLRGLPHINFSLP